MTQARATIFLAGQHGLYHCTNRCVRRAWRGQGLGRRLAEAVLGQLRQTGAVRRVDLEVRADNAPAIGLYERLGFIVEGRRALGLCHRGVYYQTLEMGLVLSTPADRRGR